LIDNYPGVFGQFINNNVGMTNIRFDTSSVKNTMGHSARNEKIALLPVVPGMIENGIYLESQPRNDHDLVSHIFASKAIIDGVPYTIGFIVREDNNGRRYYNHELAVLTESQVKPGADTQQDMPVTASIAATAPQQPTARQSAHESINTIVQKWLGVNPNGTLHTEPVGSGELENITTPVQRRTTPLPDDTGGAGSLRESRQGNQGGETGAGRQVNVQGTDDAQGSIYDDERSGVDGVPDED
jgi:hypothetical protein